MSLTRIRKFPPSRLLPVVLLLLVSGCAGDVGLIAAPGVQPPTRIVAPPFLVGDSFVFSNGRTDTVEAIDGDRVSWINDRDFRWTAPIAFYLPDVNWQSRTRQARLTEGPPPDLLWPPAVGQSARFHSVTVVSDSTGGERRYFRNWLCSVDGSERITVDAGTFQTRRIVCFRRTDTNYLLDKTTWWYAPALGHYVRTVKESQSSGERRSQLVAALPSTRALPAGFSGLLTQAFQEALENRRSGRSVVVADASSGWRGSVRPIDVLRRTDGGYCRHYVEDVRSAAISRRYAGIACRDADGLWQVPRH